MNYSDGKPMQTGDAVIADIDGVAVPGAISEVRVDGKITFAHVHVERPSIALVHFKTVTAEHLVRLESLGVAVVKSGVIVKGAK